MAPKKSAWPDLPSWAGALLAAALAFLATWGALKATVSNLQEEVSGLRTLVQTVAVLGATSKAHDSEISALRDGYHRLLERVTILEARTVRAR
jgi:hypothetical protein